MISMATTNRLAWIDALRLMAGLSMVGLHATADSSGQPWPNFEPSERIIPVLMRSVLYIARTELFIIISIFLLFLALDKRPRSYRTSISEQSKRLLIPYIFWTFFFSAYGLFKAQSLGYYHAEIDRLSDPLAWLKIILLGEAKYHMHFIPTLFGVVLMFPLYNIAVRHPAIGLVVIVCLLLKSQLDAFVFSTFWGTDILGYLVRTIKILTYAGYGLVAASIFGIYTRYKGDDLIAWLPILLFIGGMLFLLKLVAGYKIVLTGSYPYTYLPGYWADFLMPIVLFAVCFCTSGLPWSTSFSQIAKYSFGIYLCHPIFLDIAEIAVSFTNWSPAQIILFKILMTVPLTTAMVILLGRSNSLGWTIGLKQLPWKNHIKGQLQ